MELVRLPCMLGPCSRQASAGHDWGAVWCEIGSLVVKSLLAVAPLLRHPGFRLFGCMNPATDVGKRDLPPAIKARFTELYVGDTNDRADLCAIVASYLAGAPRPPVDDVVDFFEAARAAAERVLLDSAGQKPAYSLRTLVRGLEYARAAMGTYGLARALWDGLAMTFGTLLSGPTRPALDALLERHVLKGGRRAELLRPPAAAAGGPPAVLFGQFWVEVRRRCGPSPLLLLCSALAPRLSLRRLILRPRRMQAGPGYTPLPDGETDSADSAAPGSNFVLTPSVQGHLSALARAVLVRRYPVLLQVCARLGVNLAPPSFHPGERRDRTKRALH